MELMAIVFALKAWCHYLYDEQYEVFLVHKSGVHFYIAGPQHEVAQVDGILGGL